MRSQTVINRCGVAAITIGVATALVSSPRPRRDATRRRAGGDGRGLDHLSAALEEGDLVCYQIGSWKVDGVVVGDGAEPECAFAVVDTLSRAARDCSPSCRRRRLAVVVSLSSYRRRRFPRARDSTAFLSRPRRRRARPQAARVYA